ncbi:YdcF family protein [Orrella sp. JC864]|uniref:YdcF family protein n=1 Tax=Orrella sp. JC864 TaxID=3120298 RepID=UPI0012BBE122
MPSMSSLLTSLVVPLNLSITVLVIAVVLGLLRCRRAAALLFVGAIGWSLAWSLPGTSLWLGGALERNYPYLPAQQMPVADAIVVLGGHTANSRANWFEAYDPKTARPRIDRAAELYKAGRAGKVVLSGGALEGQVSEAQGMAHGLRQLGVPDSALILENSSRTTYENAALTLQTLQDHDIRTVLLVTSALHMPRAMAAFRKQGIAVVAAPNVPQIVPPQNPPLPRWWPDMRTMDASRSIIKEYVGLMVYRLRGWV